ncbi:Imm26 family immunity protein [Isobaculum melis]|uniref:Immunity protein 26 n=1 Tax=Isobaculum melis TaxID=142588 RepID=A0A1H9T088_9LACT|nr:Imm26 family immunity protein [Isobaculum melis]SER90526.1 Immunity protein 26 [Isobaculum melis]
MNKIPYGSIVEIKLPDDRYAYGKYFFDSYLGIYDILSIKQLSINNLDGIKIKLYKCVNELLIKKGKWSIIGCHPLTGNNIYTPSLAQYAEWIAEDSIRRGAITYKGNTLYISETEYVEHLKRGHTTSVFNRPEQFPEFILNNLEEWPNYSIPVTKLKNKAL